MLVIIKHFPIKLNLTDNIYAIKEYQTQNPTNMDWQNSCILNKLIRNNCTFFEKLIFLQIKQTQENCNVSQIQHQYNNTQEIAFNTNKHKDYQEVQSITLKSSVVDLTLFRDT